MTIREALLSMGYKEQKPGQWLKPIGYQCLHYHEGRNMWTNYFKSVSGEVMSYELKQLNDDTGRFGSYVKQLKEWECFTRTDMWVNGNSEFELGGIDL